MLSDCVPVSEHACPSMCHSLFGSACVRAYGISHPGESPGVVCFLSGPKLWREGGKGATKARTSALPGLLEASKQTEPLRSPRWGPRILGCS